MRAILTAIGLLWMACQSQAASSILTLISTGDTANVSSNRIVLANSYFARGWSAQLGTNWTKVRVALRIIMTNTAANLTGTPVFAVGICAGTNNTYQNTVCSNFVGVNTTAATWTYSPGPPVRYSTGAIPACTKVQESVTNFSNWATSHNFMADSSSTNRSLFFVDITKGVGTNFTVGGFLRTGITSFEATYSDFLLQSETASPALSQHAAASSVQVPVDEPANGYLDTVNVAWGRTSPPIHIVDVFVVKLQDFGFGLFLAMLLAVITAWLLNLGHWRPR